MNCTNNAAFAPYLASSAIIDADHPAVAALARRLRIDDGASAATARRCFEFVRDEIEHCIDHQRDEVTLSASQTLLVGTGFCYAKSHLLAALLRGNGIPAALCYQRLSVSGAGAPYCLHGLNAVYLPDFGWYRIDARGNNENVQARFAPPTECLAFPLTDPREASLPGLWAEPVPLVVEALQRHRSARAMAQDLPDVDPARDEELRLPGERSQMDRA